MGWNRGIACRIGEAQGMNNARYFEFRYLLGLSVSIGIAAREGTENLFANLLWKGLIAIYHQTGSPCLSPWQHSNFEHQYV
jgi:hypothetical protein